MSDRKPKPEEIIFDAAAQIENRPERDAYVKNACGADERLLDGVQALLRHHDVGAFLDTPIFEEDNVAPEKSFPVSEGPGTVIGRYKLLEKIGEGGMAVVYMAEQQEPIRRKVALKIIKLGMDTRQVIARFEAERQALALMDHPSIAKVLDAGATETGRPYFVMELVQGVSITEYCDRNSLNTKDRLALFVQVCNAVQHAHQKGIIHRDLKPSNAVERGNRRHRKMQKSVYRVRTHQTISRRIALDMQRDLQAPARHQTTATLHQQRREMG
jgi:hypothetical protein